MSAKSLIALVVVACLGTPSLFAQSGPRLFKPRGAGPFPAVLFVPGCSGFVSFNGVNGYEERAKELADAGFIVLFVDYLAKRGLSNCANTSFMSVGSDVIGAATWVRTLADVDATKVYAIGWSFGGGGILSALVRLPRGDSTLTKVVAISPNCLGAQPWGNSTPMLLLLGALDDVTPPRYCDPIIKGTVPGLIKTIVYPNARHGFDLRSLPESMPYALGSGTLGYDAEADQSSRIAIREFLN